MAEKASSSTDVAAITWLTSNGDQETRVYYQDDSGNIREQMCSNGSWKPGNGGRPLTRTSSGSRISANYWYQENMGGDQIRVYFTGSDGSVTEWCYTGNKGWFEGVRVV